MASSYLCESQTFPARPSRYSPTLPDEPRAGRSGAWAGLRECFYWYYRFRRSILQAR